jgi:hypothetical protein
MSLRRMDSGTVNNDIKNENEKEEDDAWAAFGSDIDETEENEIEDDDDDDNNHVINHNDDMVVSMMDNDIDPARDGIGNSNNISSSKSNSSSTTIKYFSRTIVNYIVQLLVTQNPQICPYQRHIGCFLSNDNAGNNNNNSDNNPTSTSKGVGTGTTEFLTRVAAVATTVAKPSTENSFTECTAVNQCHHALCLIQERGYSILSLAVHSDNDNNNKECQSPRSLLADAIVLVDVSSSSSTSSTSVADIPNPNSHFNAYNDQFQCHQQSNHNVVVLSLCWNALVLGGMLYLVHEIPDRSKIVIHNNKDQHNIDLHNLTNANKQANKNHHLHTIIAGYCFHPLQWNVQQSTIIATTTNTTNQATASHHRHRQCIHWHGFAISQHLCTIQHTMALGVPSQRRTPAGWTHEMEQLRQTTVSLAACEIFHHPTANAVPQQTSSYPRDGQQPYLAAMMMIMIMMIMARWYRRWQPSLR